MRLSFTVKCVSGGASASLMRRYKVPEDTGARGFDRTVRAADNDAAAPCTRTLHSGSASVPLALTDMFETSCASRCTSACASAPADMEKIAAYSASRTGSPPCAHCIRTLVFSGRSRNRACTISNRIAPKASPPSGPTSPRSATCGSFPLTYGAPHASERMRRNTPTLRPMPTAATTGCPAAASTYHDDPFAALRSSSGSTKPELNQMAPPSEVVGRGRMMLVERREASSGTETSSHEHNNGAERLQR